MICSVNILQFFRAPNTTARMPIMVKIYSSGSKYFDLVKHKNPPSLSRVVIHYRTIDNTNTFIDWNNIALSA